MSKLYIMDLTINNNEYIFLTADLEAEAHEKCRRIIKEKHIIGPDNKSSYSIRLKNKFIYKASISNYRKNYTIELLTRKNS